MFQRIKHVHFVGIGGSGMSGIAEVLLTLGYRVTGSDIRGTAVTRALAAAGAGIYTSHEAGNVHGAHVVVRSSAVESENLELAEARRRKIPVISRAEMLAELARLKYTIAVAGTHGKTTTTSMVATILDHAGMDPTFVIGGRLNTVGRNARLGKGEFIVVEADESDRSFLMLSPTIAVVTNVEADHLDHYRDLADIQDAFAAFANKVPFYGAVVLPSTPGTLGSAAVRLQRRTVSFGLDEEADTMVTDIALKGLGSSFTIRYNGGRRQRCTLGVPGVHNVLNAAAAFAASFEMGVEPETIAAAFESFQGVERRFQVKARHPLTIIDDYAHHPTEIRAVIRAARAAGFSRVWAAFQPHRYSRTHHLFNEFARAFEGADAVLITTVYPAGEPPIPGVSGAALAASVREQGAPEAFYMPDLEEMEAYIRSHARPGDAVLVMGAGNITSLADALARPAALRVSHE